MTPTVSLLSPSSAQLGFRPASETTHSRTQSLAPNASSRVRAGLEWRFRVQGQVPSKDLRFPPQRGTRWGPQAPMRVVLDHCAMSSRRGRRQSWRDRGVNLAKPGEPKHLFASFVFPFAGSQGTPLLPACLDLGLLPAHSPLYPPYHHPH